MTKPLALFDWSVVMPGSGQNFLTQEGSIFCCSGRVRLVWVWEISTKNTKFFKFFSLSVKKYLSVASKSTWVKGGSASYILHEGKSMLGLGQGPTLLQTNGRQTKIVLNSTGLKWNLTITDCKHCLRIHSSLIDYLTKCDNTGFTTMTREIWLFIYF